jgi:hypothetical protein
MQPRQSDRISPVRLDPLTRPLRDQGRGDHGAVVTELAHLPAQPVARRPGLKADVQPVIALAELLDRPLDCGRLVLDLAEEPDLTRAAALGDRHRVLQLCHIKRHERFAILPHGSPSVREARLGPPEQPSSAHACQG